MIGVSVMHSLVAKIFLAYWLAAGVVIVIADLQPHKLVHTPELSDALDTSLTMNARGLIGAYKSGNCASVAGWHNQPSDGIALTSSDGRLLCGDLKTAGLQQLIAGAVAGKARTTRDFSRYQIIAVPITGPDGGLYVLLVKSHYSSVLHVFGSLPGSKTIEVSVVVTFFLAILIVLPLRRLRTAARQIADGNLSARVNAGFFSRCMTRISLRDDIDGLMRDFNAMAERLQSLVNAQKLLMRDVSHELRSPLARLAVALELAKDGRADSLPVHLARIERESLRLNSLIGHILSFSYIESIRDLRRSVDLSLNALVQELLPDVQYEAEGRHCRIVTCTPRDFIVTGDSDMLRHAVENIVRNAIRYSPAGGTVEIDIDIDEKDGCPGAVLRVSDSGPGVAEDKLHLILNPFYRAESRRGSSSGFGIGLAIADRAAHLHAGQIVARNRKGGGLVVEMSLPLAPSFAQLGQTA
jgi:two-component system sensor histidine kinase CpxA